MIKREQISPTFSGQLDYGFDAQLYDQVGVELLEHVIIQLEDKLSYSIQGQVRGRVLSYIYSNIHVKMFIQGNKGAI